MARECVYTDREREGAAMKVTRAIALLVATWLVLVALTAIQAAVPLEWSCRLAAPDVVLLLVLFVGLEAPGSLVSACVFGVAAGWMADLFHGSPRGLHMLAYGIAVIIARLASSRLLVRGRFAIVVVAAIFSLGFGVLVVALRASFESEVGWAPLRVVPWAALSTAIAAPIVFRLLARIDRRFRRDPRSLLGGRPPGVRPRPSVTGLP
jgi:rod shape-determining protein MreD